MWLHTYYLDSVSWRGSDVPGALLTAGILIRPVRAAQGPTGAVDLMLALSWIHTGRNTRANTHRKEVNHGCTGKGQRKWKGNPRKEKGFQIRTSWSQVQGEFCKTCMHTVLAICCLNCSKNWKNVKKH